jgi:hypothetical protein
VPEARGGTTDARDGLGARQRQFDPRLQSRRTKVRPTILLLAAAFLASPAHGFVQLNDTGEVDIGDSQRDLGGNSRVGLLGLLGLAGLLGLKRREPDIHVDARREK